MKTIREQFTELINESDPKHQLMNSSPDTVQDVCSLMFKVRGSWETFQTLPWAAQELFIFTCRVTEPWDVFQNVKIAGILYSRSEVELFEWLETYKEIYRTRSSNPVLLNIFSEQVFHLFVRHFTYNSQHNDFVKILGLEKCFGSDKVAEFLQTLLDDKISVRKVDAVGILEQWDELKHTSSAWMLSFGEPFVD